MSRIYLDVETAGIKGKLNLVQYQIDTGEIKLIRPFKQPKEMEILKSLLKSEQNIVLGYNIGFDIWKLYQYYNCEPFNCKVIDLWLHMQRDKPFNHFPVRGKSIIVIKKVPSVCVEKTENIITAKLKTILPEMFDIKVKHTIDKQNKDLISLSFKMDFNMKLKTLASKLFNEKTLEYEDCFELPDWSENKRVPIILEEEKELYYNLWFKNEMILDKRLF